MGPTSNGVLSVDIVRVRDWFATRRPSALFALAALVICYAETCLALAGQWYTNQAYSYAFVVPPISAFVASAQLRRHPALRPMPDYVIGGSVILLSTALFVVGELGSILALQEVSLAIAVGGTVLLFGGRSMLRLLWFPIAYLLLMVPIWDLPLDMLHGTSQLISARLATAILHSFDIPALRTDTLIILPNMTLEVARECSGINQLIAVFAIAVPAAYLMIVGNLRRTLLVLLALTIALLSNGVRIAAIGTLIYKGWAGDVHGPYHVLQGLAVSFVGFAVIGFSLIFFSNRSASSAKTQPEAPIRTAAALPRRLRPAIEVATGIVLLVAGTLQFWFAPMQLPLLATFDEFPKQIGTWSESVADPARIEELKVTGADDELVRAFRSDQGDRVHLYIGYFRSQEQDREMIGPSTQSLMDAAVSARVPLGADRDTERLNQAIRQGNQVLFWFDVNGRVLAEPYQAKLYSIVDAVARRRTNGAVVIVSWQGGEGVELDPGRLAFLRALLPLLRNHIPS
jgi:EpsI family protein